MKGITYMTAQKVNRTRIGIVATAIVVVLGLVLVVFSGPTLTKADGGTVVVVRNGGWLDDNSFREVIQPNSGITWEGWHSQEHPYPASQRYFKVSAAPGSDSNEVINVPTQDGVSVGVEGTFYFQLSTDPVILEDFDNKFGTRTYPAGDDQLHAWDEDGWGPFLSATLGNLVQNVLRQEIGKVKCADLVASCALAFNAQEVTVTDQTGNVTLATVQQNVNSGFEADVESYLGVKAFTNINFALSQVTLPQATQDAINGSFAKVADQAGKTQESQGKLAQAQIDAQTNATRQNGYNSCPICGEIDLRAAIPGGITVWAPGEDAGIALQAPAPAPAG